MKNYNLVVEFEKKTENVENRCSEFIVCKEVIRKKKKNNLQIYSNPSAF